MQKIVVESPFAGDVEANLLYLRACMRDCLLNRNESPYASHGLYTQPGVLDDTNPDERNRGIQAGFEWRQVAGQSAFYVDHGMTKGMQHGLQDVLFKRRGFEYRAFLDGLDEPSYTIKFDTIGNVIHADAPALSGGYVSRSSIEECVEALREIARERKCK